MALHIYGVTYDTICAGARPAACQKTGLCKRHSAGSWEPYFARHLVHCPHSPPHRNIDVSGVQDVCASHASLAWEMPNFSLQTAKIDGDAEEMHCLHQSLFATRVCPGRGRARGEQQAVSRTVQFSLFSF